MTFLCFCSLEYHNKLFTRYSALLSLSLPLIGTLLLVGITGVGGDKKKTDSCVGMRGGVCAVVTPTYGVMRVGVVVAVVVRGRGEGSVKGDFSFLGFGGRSDSHCDVLVALSKRRW